MPHWKTCRNCRWARQAASSAANKGNPGFKGEGHSNSPRVAVPAFPDEWGPEFSGLAPDGERRFVWAYVALGGTANAAAAMAYECKGDNAHSKVAAARCLSRPRVQESILAHSKVALRRLAPLAVLSLKQILQDPSHPDHLKGIRTVLERSDAVIQKTELAVTVSADDQALSLLKYLLSVQAGEAALQAAFGASLPRFMGMLEGPQKVIEHVPIDS